MIQDVQPQIIRLFDRLIADNYDGKIKTLVAFSGEVEDSHGRKCTEANMNDGNVFDDGIREKFKEDDYKILIVAEKFQTGFDQPLLHTMYSDIVSSESLLPWKGRYNGYRF